MKFASPFLNESSTIRTSSHTPEVNPDSLVEEASVNPPKTNTSITFVCISDVSELVINGILQRMSVDLQEPTDQRITMRLSDVPNDEKLRTFIRAIELTQEVKIRFDGELYYTSNHYVPVSFQLIREGELELVLKSN